MALGGPFHSALILWGQRGGEITTMPGLRRYIEWMSRGRRTDRTAYVMKEWDLPAPLPGAEWQLDASFNAGDEILRDPELATVYKAALEKGAELVIRRPVELGLMSKGK